MTSFHQQTQMYVYLVCLKLSINVCRLVMNYIKQHVFWQRNWLYFQLSCRPTFVVFKDVWLQQTNRANSKISPSATLTVSVVDVVFRCSGHFNAKFIIVQKDLLFFSRPLPSSFLSAPLHALPCATSYPPFFCFNHCTNSFLLMHIFKLSLDIFVYHCTLKKPDDV